MRKRKTMNDIIPIVFYQGGSYCPYLKISVRQAYKRNPNNPIIILADNPEQYRAELPGSHKIQLLAINDYSSSAKQFESIYEHLSTNPQQFELPCFMRWFVLDEYCKNHNLRQYFYLDNDVLLYCNFQDWVEDYNRFVYTMTNNVSWGISLMNDTKWLSRFCEFCMNVYGLQGDHSKFYYHKILSHYEDLQSTRRAGGVCDMTLLSFFRQDAFTPPGLVGEMSAILKEDETDTESCFVRNVYYTFDHNINQSDGFKMKNGIKDVSFERTLPVVHNEELNIDVRFLCLHFQGAAKSLMEKYCDEG